MHHCERSGRGSYLIVEIVSTGTELLLGQIVNTNAPYLAKRLNELGFDVLFQTTVGDNRSRMDQVLTSAFTRADIVITTGGLGPTQGDITKEVTANLLGLTMLLHEPSLERIKGYFESRKIQMTQNNVRQAMLPEGAVVLENDRGCLVIPYVSIKSDAPSLIIQYISPGLNGIVFVCISDLSNIPRKPLNIETSSHSSCFAARKICIPAEMTVSIAVGKSNSKYNNPAKAPSYK